MADLSITAADVGITNNVGAVRMVQVGEAVTQGQCARVSSSKYYKAQADTEANAQCVGVFLTAASTDGYAVLADPGCELDLGATLTVGETYVVSDAAAGGIAPIGDLASGDYVTIIGTAITAGKLLLKIAISGAAKA